MPRRRLSDDERELWQRVARTAKRLGPVRLTASKPEAPVADPLAQEFLDAQKFTEPQAGARRPLPMPPSAMAPRATSPKVKLDLAETISERLAREPVRMDRNLHRSMARGKLDPEARIDLHGMTVAQAHGALNGFILSAHARGLRLVLVITGKGRTTGRDHLAPMPVRAGVLKHEVPQWLRAAPLGPLVLELRESHRSHGGTGAYYVYLRKPR